MLRIKKYIFCFSISCALLVGLVDTGFAKEVSLEFAGSSSISVIQAKISETTNQALRITGQLKRPHRIPMAGHLHAYIYSANGALVAESKHRVTGLNSRRKGMMHVPFNILLEDAPADTARALLEYHDPGYPEGKLRII